MEFYFRKKGQTLGPWMLFKVREMIESGEIEPSDLGWHEGQADWLPVAQIPALEVMGQSREAADAAAEASETERPEAALKELPKKIESMEMTVALRQHVQQARQRHVAAWQRFLARSLDLLCFSLLALWLASLVGWLEPGEVTIPRFPVLMAVPLLWIFVETLCVYWWGATPGKALLGLRVVTDDGSPLPLKKSLNRAFDAWFFGCGLELPVLSWLLKILSMGRLRQLGKTSWDAALGLHVEHRPATSLGITLALASFVGAVILKLFLFLHAPLPSHLAPEERALWETIHAPPVVTEQTEKKEG